MGLPIRKLVFRLLALPLSLLIVVTLDFLIVHVLPGDPARAVAGKYAAPSVVRAIRIQLGLNRSLFTQYRVFLVDLVHGNLGISYVSKTSVASETFSRLPSDIELIVAGMIVAVALGLLLGFVGAYWQTRLPDRVVRGIVSVQQGPPDFVIGLLLLYLLYFRTRLFPPPLGQLSTVGATPPRITGMIVVDSALRGQWSTFGDALMHIILPAVSLGFVLAAIFAKVSRSSLSVALNSPQTEFARACGVRERTVAYYAWTVARAPFVTYIAILVGASLGGVAIIEEIFNWNGAAQWGVIAISSLDLPAIEGFIAVLGAATILIYFLLDIVIMLLDPRVRAQ